MCSLRAYRTSTGITKSASRYPLAHSVPSNTERASDLWHNQSKNSAAPPLPDRPVRGDTTLQNYVRELVLKDAA